MRPTQLHAKREPDGGAYDQPPLKINKDSYFIKKPRLPPSSSSSSSSASSTSSSSSSSTGITTKSHHYQQPRQPVIIYTHSPKVIHTHPRDFMALVQKLTGYTPPVDDAHQVVQDRGGHQPSSEDNESTSVVTEEHGSSVNDVPHVNSCFADHAGLAVAPPPPPPPHTAAVYDPCFNNIPFFAPSSTDFLCPLSHQPPFYNCSDSLFLMPNMKSSFSSSSSSKLDGIKEYPDL